MSVYVFLGPTLTVKEASQILEATYLPPVSMGDVYALMKREPKVIAIIDGLFERAPAVWHKEILFALAQGVRVFGSSSMGALRAAELQSFGMEGVGKVFEAYRDGLLEDDDAVAVVHGPEEFGYRAMSEALVNVCEGLRLAEAEGAIGSGTHQVLLCSAKKMFYPERSWHSVLARGAVLGLPADELAALERFVRRESPNIKRADAIELLGLIARECAEGIAPNVPNFCFEPTVYWSRLVGLGESTGSVAESRNRSD
jgi:hypothetical protein